MRSACGEVVLGGWPHVPAGLGGLKRRPGWGGAACGPLVLKRRTGLIWPVFG